VNIESLSEYFSSFGKVLSVRLRRDADKTFKGKSYVEFATQGEADKAAKNKEQTWGSGKTPLEIFTKYSMSIYFWFYGNFVDRTEYFEARKQKTKAVKEEKKRKREEGGDSGDKKDAFASGLIVELKGVAPTTERDNIKVP
jgi:RNA recognition motif-containing protein